MAEKLRYLLIVNPEAGSRRTMKALPAIDAIMRREKVEFEFHFTEQPGHATELVKEFGDRFDVVVSVGGDGTINEVLNGLPDLDKSLGMIPIGTGNDFARSCSIPHDSVEDSIQILLANNVRKLDVGDANGRRFINVMGMGFEGRANEVGRALGFITGATRYLLAIAYTFITYRRIPVKITCGETVLDNDLFLASIGNGWNVGGGLQLTPKARLDDGLLDLCYIKHISRPKIIAVFNRLYDGSIDTVHEVSSFKADEITIECDRHLPMHIDGENFPLKGKCTVKLLKNMQAVIGNWSADTRFDA